MTIKTSETTERFPSETRGVGESGTIKQASKVLNSTEDAHTKL